MAFYISNTFEHLFQISISKLFTLNKSKCQREFGVHQGWILEVDNTHIPHILKDIDSEFRRICG